MDITQEHIDLLRAQLEVLQRMHGPVRKYAGRNCQKGYNCGGSCITRRKNCRKALQGEAKNFSEWMVNKMSAEIGAAVGEAPVDKPKSPPKAAPTPPPAPPEKPKPTVEPKVEQATPPAPTDKVKVKYLDNDGTLKSATVTEAVVADLMASKGRSRDDIISGKVTKREVSLAKDSITKQREAQTKAGQKRKAESDRIEKEMAIDKEITKLKSQQITGTGEGASRRRQDRNEKIKELETKKKAPKTQKDFNNGVQDRLKNGPVDVLSLQDEMGLDDKQFAKFVNDGIAEGKFNANRKGDSGFDPRKAAQDTFGRDFQDLNPAEKQQLFKQRNDKQKVDAERRRRLADAGLPPDKQLIVKG